MACGIALKRTHDYDAYLSPESSGAKRSRTSAGGGPHCSPFRAQLGTVAASLPSSVVVPSASSTQHPQTTSPFAGVGANSNLSSEQLESYLRAEVRYLKRRRLIPRHSTTSTGAVESSSANSTSTYRAAPSSPTNQSVGSDSDGEGGSAPPSTHHRLNQATSIDQLYDRPHFSLRQVKMICERLLKEQEMRMRYEYETVLNRRLEEQHGQYVQFAQEQIERRYDDNVSCTV